MDSQGDQGRTRKGQEDQGDVKELWGTHLAVSRSPGLRGLPSGSSLCSLSIHQTSLSYSLDKGNGRKDLGRDPQRLFAR